MKIGLTTDSSSGLEYAPFKHHVLITKTQINFGDETLIDGVDITADEFYERLEKERIIPTTSAPTTGEIVTQINKLVENGCTHVIHFPISTELSAYGKNLENIIQPLFPNIVFKVCDTKSATLLQGMMVRYAETLVNQGLSIDEVIEKTLAYRKRANAYFIVDDLKYLIKNGRLSQLSGTIGILAKIKPILSLNQAGKIETIEKVRVHHKAVERMIEMVLNDTKEAKSVSIILLHTNRLEDATRYKLHLEKVMTNIKEILISTITPTVGAHIGSKILGIGYIIHENN